MDTDIIDTNGIATMAGKSPFTVRRWLRAGLLPPPTIVPRTNVRLWRRSEISEALAKLGSPRQGVKLRTTVESF